MRRRSDSFGSCPPVVHTIHCMVVIWEYRSSANEKEKKDAAAKIKKQQEQKELVEALEVTIRTLNRAVFACDRKRLGLGEAGLSPDSRSSIRRRLPSQPERLEVARCTRLRLCFDC